MNIHSIWWERERERKRQTQSQKFFHFFSCFLYSFSHSLNWMVIGNVWKHTNLHMQNQTKKRSKCIVLNTFAEKKNSLQTDFSQNHNASLGVQCTRSLSWVQLTELRSNHRPDEYICDKCLCYSHDSHFCVYHCHYQPCTQTHYTSTQSSSDEHSTTYTSCTVGTQFKVILLTMCAQRNVPPVDLLIQMLVQRREKWPIKWNSSVLQVLSMYTHTHTLIPKTTIEATKPTKSFIC